MEQAIALDPGFGPALAPAAYGYEEALHWAARSRAEQPNFDVSHWHGTAALGHLGRTQAATQALTTLLTLSPGTSLSQLRRANHGKFPERWQVVIESLRRAGLPEHPPA